ncbi:MAG: oxidoreductase [Deltaproteobacteria bacterium RBG_13_52_11b]|nr:MAG: oxidoreductase [Deltaproteobacteria bacterium RBG_13_52_11b]
MAGKPKVAMCWLGACGGCDEAVVDLNEVILQVADAVDFVLWPVALDFKYKHIESMKDGEINLSIVSGSVRNSEQEEIAHLLRKKSQLVLSFGTCACFGGTAGLANFRTKEDILNWVYRDAPTVVNPERHIPQTKTWIGEKELTLPEFYDHVFTLDQIIPVDYYLPGCPPPPDLIANAVNAVVKGDLPPKGSALAPRQALCDVCVRNKTKPYRMEIDKIRRVHEVEADPDTCFLAKGILCLGLATRAGCGETCIRTNMPCRGCFGPVEGVEDAGAKYLSAVASLLKVERDEDIKPIVDSIVDPAGCFYRFTQPSSILGKKKAEKVKEG